MLTRSGRRLIVALLVIGSLLFQQVAVAAFACDPAAQRGPTPVSHCDQSHTSPPPTRSPLCEKHCVPDSTVLTNTVAMGVPALALPPVVFTLVVHEPSASLDRGPTVALIRPDPPPRLRYCTLLI